MASEDVIELGSSDDEAQPPPPKKIKPKQNAMVHIPGKTFQSLTIKPINHKDLQSKKQGLTMKSLKDLQPRKEARRPSDTAKPVLLGKSITCTKVSNGNKVSIVKISPKTQNRSCPKIKEPTSVLNPYGPAGNLLHKLIKPNSSTKTNIVSKQNNRSIAPKLPPSITVTRTFPKGKPGDNIKIVNTRTLQKSKPRPKPVSKEVLTVDLDDDEGPETPKPSSASAPWYLPPETESKDKEMEKKNNEEPKPNFIEITIEDSPIKPPLNKRTCEVGAELAITVEDSPMKTVTQRAEDGSDEEANNTTPKTPNSKKRLEYPKEASSTIEIEIEPMEVDDPLSIPSEKHLKNPYTIPIEILDSPVKKTTSDSPVREIISDPTVKKTISDSPVKKTTCSPKKAESSEKAVQSSEFHPVYQSFIDLCLKLEDSEDMRKIVDKKIKGYYKQVPREYTESEEFVDMVSSKILSMKVGPEKMYLYIKDIVDELNLQRKMAKSQVMQKEVNTEPEPFIYGENSEFDTKRQRQIRKLEKTLKKLHRAIQKLEEQEVDFDDEEDSVYLLTERYKERMVRVHAKLCQLTNTKMPSEPRVHIDSRPGKPSGPAKKLEKWINKKVPIGTPLPFPDFHDVLRCVREANDEDKLGWNEVDVMEEARDLFVRCGKKLQRRRQENEWRLAASRLPVDIDPAEDSDLLRKKLDDNRLVASKKETEVFNKYADRQSQLKLEAVEIGDKEAEESPVDSDDEEPQEEEATLENKEKRKERLKRLIQEKTKKSDEQTDPKVNDENESTENVLEDKREEETAKPTDSIEPSDNANEKEENPDNDNDKEAGNGDKDEGNREEVQFIDSDDPNKVDSDIDELHLLQKLHSENEVNSSTIESSDSDTPIDISDTLQSSSDNKGNPSNNDDVISIENSSYSESEANDANSSKESVETADKMVDATEEIELSCTPPEKKTQQDNNDEYSESVENILLASSDDEKRESDNDNMTSNDKCVNLRDDTTSILDTGVGESKNNKSGGENANENVVSPDSESITMIEDSRDVNDADSQNPPIHASDEFVAMDTDETQAVPDSNITSKIEEISDKSDTTHMTSNGVTQKSSEIKENNGNVANLNDNADILEIEDNSNKSNESESSCDRVNQIEKAKPIDMLVDNVDVTPNEITTTAVDSAA